MSETPSIIYREATVEDSYAVAQVHVKSWRESFAGLVPQSFMDNMTVEKRAKAFASRATNGFYKMFLAETLEERVVVGFMDVGKPRDGELPYDAELYAIYLLKEFQRKGIGQELFRMGVEALVAEGMHSMYLLALEVSPYRPFYEKLGGRLAGRKVVTLDGVDFFAVVYAWDSLTLESTHP